MNDLLRRIEQWYARQCDGEWEHTWGVRIETLDNPGWRMSISVRGTELEGGAFERIEEGSHEHGGEWVVCELRQDDWFAAGSPDMLRRMLQEFLDWADRHRGQTDR